MSTSLGGRRDARIDLSSKVIDNVDRLRDTLAHEMCHAAQWLLDGSAKPPHGARFKYWAKKFEGAVAGVGITTCHSYEIHYKYRYRCDGRAEMPPRSRRGRHVSHARLRVTGARTSLGGSRSRSTWTDSGARGAMGRSRCSVRRDDVVYILHRTPIECPLVAVIRRIHPRGHAAKSTRAVGLRQVRQGPVPQAQEGARRPQMYSIFIHANRFTSRSADPNRSGRARRTPI